MVLSKLIIGCLKIRITCVLYEMVIGLQQSLLHLLNEVLPIFRGDGDDLKREDGHYKNTECTVLYFIKSFGDTLG